MPNLPPWHGTSLSVGRSAPRLRRRFTVQRLRSATTSALVGRRTQRLTIGDRAFVAAAPAV